MGNKEWKVEEIIKRWPTAKRLTPSEASVVCSYLDNEVTEVLYLDRSRGGWLNIYINKKQLPQTSEHKPPYKYRRIMIGARGAKLHTWAGNIWDEEHKDIIDDWTEDRRSHLTGYSSK